MSLKDNGGDALVAARHLSYINPNHICDIVLLKKYSDSHKVDLLKSLTPFENVTVRMISDTNIEVFAEENESYCCILDGIFGYSFKGPIKPELANVFDFLKETAIPIFSIDVPSGWDIEKGNIYETFTPKANISLGCVKTSMEGYKGVHYFADHFMPRKLLASFGVTNPLYEDPEKLFTII